jgi:hypothetical protein
MREVFDHHSLFYEEPNDTPYMFTTGLMSSHYLSNEGFYGVSTWSTTSGIFPPVTNAHGGSDHWTWMPIGGFFYWNETRGDLVFVGNSSPEPVIDPPKPTQNLNYECLFMGNYGRTDAHVLFRDKAIAGTYYLYALGLDAFMAASVTDIRSLTSSSKLTQSTMIAANETNAKILYFVHNNELWEHNLVDNSERQITVPGGINGEITYISNRHYNHSYAPAFNYFAIATFNNGEYQLSMFNMIGGIPDGEPVLQATGQGKIKATHFLAPDFNDVDIRYYQCTYSH